MQNPAFRIVALTAAAALILMSASTAAETNENRRAELIGRGVEAVLGQVLGVSVSVESVGLDTEAQRVVLKNVRIANPRGFSDGYALAAGRVEAEADIDGLFDRSPLLKKIVVKDADVHSETRVDRGNNLKRLADAARDFQRRPAARLMQRQQREWRIEEGVIDGGEVAFTTVLLERNTTRRPLDRIELDLRDHEGRGLTPAEAMSRVLTQIVMGIGGVEPDSGLGNLLNGVRRLW